MPEQTPWLRSNHRGPARLNLYVFPYAGAGPAAFHTWAHHLPSWIALHLVALPGREGRFHEDPLSQSWDIVQPVTDVIATRAEVPFVLLGHSMGSILAFEVARRLRRTGRKGPSALIVSGSAAPHLPSRTPRLSGLRGPELIRQLSELYGGIPQEILGDEELVGLMARVLSADVRVVEGYRYVAEPPLDWPIAAFGGDADPWVSRADLAAWRDHTAREFVADQYDGDHFYFRSLENERALLERVSRICGNVVSGRQVFA